MKNTKLIFTLFVGIAILAAQVGSVFAAPALQEGFITGKVTEVTCETDSNTDVTTFLVTVTVDGTIQTVQIDQATAVSLGIIAPDTACSEEALAGAIGLDISIDPAVVIPDDEEGMKHPVGLALSLFFDDVTDYEAIMEAHADGTGFGVIAQALWLTLKMEGDSDAFMAVLEAKETGDFSAFALEDGTVLQNWGQFKKAVLDGDKKGNLGVVMSGRDMDDVENTGNGNVNSNGNGNGQDKDKSNNGNNGNKNKDKDKGKK